MANMFPPIETPLPTLDAQAQEWLRNRAQTRAMGAVPAAPVAAPAAPVAAPAAGGAVKSLGRMAGRFGAPLALGAMGLGVIDKMQEVQAAPGVQDPSESLLKILSGADVTGLGGWLGRAMTGRTEPAAAPAVAPAAGAPATPTSFGAVPAFQSQVRAVDNRIMGDTTARLYPDGPPLTSFGAADITGRGIPVSGTGGVMNSRGVVSDIDSRETLTPADIEANALHAQGKSVYGVGNQFGAAPVMGTPGGYVGAVMNQRQAAATEAMKMANAKILAELALRTPGAAKDAAEAAAWNERLRLAGGEHDPTKRSVLLGARPGPQPHALQFPLGLQPVTQDPKNPFAVVGDPNTGMVRSTPIVAASQTMTFAQAKALAMKNPQYKFSSDAQLRHDLDATGKYKLTD